jgi:hypothetical protein
LKQREEERRRLQKAEKITELYTSPNIEFSEIITEPIIGEISTSVAGLGEIINLWQLQTDIEFFVLNENNCLLNK